MNLNVDWVVFCSYGILCVWVKFIRFVDMVSEKW